MALLRHHKFLCRSPEAVLDGLHAVETICRKRGLQFTKNRWLVLESLLQAEQPMTAYELLRALETRLERQISPPTVYRALAFLSEHDFVSRIETTNAYVPTPYPDHTQPYVFFICETCGSLAEIENRKLEALFESDAASLGFRIGKRVIELKGACANCQAMELTAD
jgi:Fur family zinc uptake transcriptional regulator